MVTMGVAKKALNKRQHISESVLNGENKRTINEKAGKTAKRNQRGNRRQRKHVNGNQQYQMKCIA